MKNKFQIILSLLTMFILHGCGIYNKVISDSPRIYFSKEFSPGSIAVLSFIRQGAAQGDLGKLSADKLTEALFFSGAYNVIDRAAINDAEDFLEVHNTESMSLDQVQKLGLKLKANYLVIGKIQETKKAKYLENDSSREFSISFRIISVLNSDLMGIVTYSFEYSGNNFQAELTKRMNEIVKKMTES